MLIWLWLLVWGRNLNDGEKVEKVLGWRTARVTTRGGGKLTITPMPILTMKNKYREWKRNR